MKTPYDFQRQAVAQALNAPGFLVAGLVEIAPCNKFMFML